MARCPVDIRPPLVLATLLPVPDARLYLVITEAPRHASLLAVWRARDYTIYALGWQGGQRLSDIPLEEEVELTRGGQFDLVYFLRAFTSSLVTSAWQW